MFHSDYFQQTKLNNYLLEALSINLHWIALRNKKRIYSNKICWAVFEPRNNWRRMKKKTPKQWVLLLLLFVLYWNLVQSDEKVYHTVKWIAIQTNDSFEVNHFIALFDLSFFFVHTFFILQYYAIIELPFMWRGVILNEIFLFKFTQSKNSIFSKNSPRNLRIYFEAIRFANDVCLQQTY